MYSRLFDVILFDIFHFKDLLADLICSAYAEVWGPCALFYIFVSLEHFSESSL